MASAGSVETSWGTFYEPWSLGKQIATAAAAFAGCVVLGWIVSHIPSDLSEAAQTMLYVPFVVVFIAGYGLWSARLQAIAWEAVGRSLFKALFIIIVKRRRPEGLEEVVPTKERATEMAVRAQRAASSFAIVSWPTAIAVGVSSVWFDTTMSRTALFVLVTTSTLGWGYLLMNLGRRGRLPMLGSE